MEDVDGLRVRISSRRSQALIAMLATARNGERTRAWLQAHLWSTRAESQAKASLRRELSNLRPLLNTGPRELLRADHERVKIELLQLDVDPIDEHRDAEFLEGLEIPGEEAFEDWLREMRSAIRSGRSVQPTDAKNESQTGLRTTTSSFPTISVLTIGTQPTVERSSLHDGIAHALVDRISRLRWLTVILGPRTPLPDSEPTQIENFCSTLGADYLLLVELFPDKRLALSLCRFPGLQVLWSDHSAFPDGLSQEALEGVLAEVVAVLSSKIDSDQKILALQLSQGSVSTNQLLWKARWHMHRYKREDALKAAELFDDALHKGGDHHEIRIEKLHLNALAAWNKRADVEQIKQLRSEAIERKHYAPYDCRGHFLCGVFEMWLGNHSQASANLEQAIALNPSMSNAYGQLGSCHNLAGRPEMAVPLLEAALRLNPLDTENFHQHGELAFAHLAIGEPIEAAAAADRALALKPGYAYAHVLKVAACVQIGKRSSIARAYSALTSAKPSVDSDFLQWIPYTDRQWPVRLKAAVEEAASITLRLGA